MFDKLRAKHHENQADANRDVAAVQRSRGNEKGAQVMKRLAREEDEKAAQLRKR